VRGPTIKAKKRGGDREKSCFLALRGDGRPCHWGPRSSTCRDTIAGDGVWALPRVVFLAMTVMPAEHVGQLCMAGATVLRRRPSNFRSRHEFLVVADDSTDLGQKGRNVCWLRDAISHRKTHAVYAIPVRSTRWVISTYWFVSIDRPGTPGQTLQDTIAMLYAFLQRRGQLNKRTCLINVR